MKAITQQWLDKAKEDIDAIERLIEVDHLANVVAFHSQQAVEKCFKALMEENNIEIIKIHNLERLFKIIKKYLLFEINIDTIIELDKIYTDSRYPSLMGSLPNGVPGKTEAMNFHEYALDIYSKISLLLKETK